MIIRRAAPPTKSSLEMGSGLRRKNQRDDRKGKKRAHSHSSCTSKKEDEGQLLHTGTRGYENNTEKYRKE